MRCRFAVWLVGLGLLLPVTLLGQDGKAKPPADETLQALTKKLTCKVAIDPPKQPVALSLALDRAFLAGPIYVFDPSVDATTKITAHYPTVMPLKDLLEKVLASASKDLTYELYRGVVYVTVKEKGKKEPPAPQLTAAATKKLATEVNPGSGEKELAEIAAWLEKATGAKFSVEEGLKAKVAIRGSGLLKLSDTLDVVCRLTETKLEA